MSLSALSSSSAASALSFLSRLSSTNSISSNSTEGVRPPPPPPEDGGGFADAIAEALKSIGITDTSSDSAAAAASTDTSDSATADTTTDTTGVAAALGSFLQSLMGALHAQHSDSAEAPPPYGEQQGGPGKLETDLQSLIAELASGTTAADSAAGTGSSDAVDQLESTFANLLDKLGVSTDSTDGSTSTDTRLTAFLQALSSKVGGNGTSGNLVNTAV
ncbi:hypothetical protein [Duganella sp.]|uniref:hypothetical protein n=1 Tax=Duganella sp. TaxID=1904440 RepID=UPI0031E1F2DE